ncbi:MAG: alpha/beta hydrolase [Bacteroidales bacterium]|nr:alpha/beta hydrolase [Bacteroidales bacterium]
MQNKGLKITLAVIGVLVMVYLLGPTMPKPELSKDLPQAVLNPQQAEQMILAQEAGFDNIRPGNQSRLIWANDSLKNKTDYCLLYLHGFSASPEEGSPVHENFARHYGMNAYIPRLAEHGLITDDALLNMTPDRLWESAKIAFVEAKALGDKVIVMGTSTGGTLALMLAAYYPDDVAGIYLFSPNVRLYDKTSALLDKPWGLQIVRKVMGGDYRVLDEDPKTDDYWYRKYRVESLVYLQQLVKTTMRADLFKQVTCPVFTGYYYKDEDHQDNTVSVEATQWMFDNLGTADSLKQELAFPDAGVHVICCDLTSGQWEDVQKAAISFGADVLGLQAMDK